jgi:hypothetical protein
VIAPPRSRPPEGAVVVALIVATVWSFVLGILVGVGLAWLW